MTSYSGNLFPLNFKFRVFQGRAFRFHPCKLRFRRQKLFAFLPVGWAQLVADGSGGVKAAGEDAAGVSALVVSAGTAEIGMIL